MTDCSYAVVRDVARALRWKVVREGADEDGNLVAAAWDMRWSDLSVDPNRVLNMSSRQKTNHWPGMAVLCRKGDLARSLSAVASLAPVGTYDFVPPTWVLPADASLLQEHLAGMHKGKKSKRCSGDYFIVKPVKGSMGKGIQLVAAEWKAVERATKEAVESVAAKLCQEVVVQQVIPSPLLLDGRKFDIRLYVLVTAVSPLQVSIYHDGLVRLCGAAFSAPTRRNLRRSQVHLTNWSLNKRAASGDGAVEDEDEHRLRALSGDCPLNGAGLKRSLTWFKKWFVAEGGDLRALTLAIDQLVARTLCAAQPELAHKYHSCVPGGAKAEGGKSGDAAAVSSKCFEVLGFDVLIDEDHKPWLIEVRTYALTVQIELEVT